MPNSMNASLSTYTSMMRVTSAHRPYAKDMFDLFSALLIQLPLKEHRSPLFRSYQNTFTTEEAAACLADLKFTHIVRTPDPADPTRQVSTRTTTTFSMSPSMAKTLGQHFLNARLIENASDPTNRTMKDKGIWQVTPKGKYMIQEFSQRAHVSISHMRENLSRIESFKIFAFERLADDDKLAFARTNLTAGFRTMMNWLPTEKLLADDVGGVKEKNLIEYQHTFYGYQCVEWISEYTTATTREEAEMIAAEFVLFGWIQQIRDKADRSNKLMHDDDVIFKSAKSTLYYVTERGKKVLGWDEPDSRECGSIACDKGSITSSSAHSEASQEAKQSMKTSSSKAATGSETYGSLKGVPATMLAELASGNPLEPEAIAAAMAASTLDSLSPDQQQQASSKPIVRNISSGTQDSGYDKGNVEGSFSSPSSRSRPVSMTDHPPDIEFPSADILTSNSETQKDSQWTRLGHILEDPLVRMYYRDFMKANFCEENINFWVDYYSLRKKCRTRAGQKELLTDSYAIYDTYLSPRAKSEVNIDHALRQEIVQLVTSTFSVVAGVTSDLPFTAAGTIHANHQVVVINGPGAETLNSLFRLYDRVNDHICRIMAQDCVPRFIKTQKFRDLLASPAMRDSPERYQIFAIPAGPHNSSEISSSSLSS